MTEMQRTHLTQHRWDTEACLDAMTDVGAAGQSRQCLTTDRAIALLAPMQEQLNVDTFPFLVSSHLPRAMREVHHFSFHRHLRIRTDDLLESLIVDMSRIDRFESLTSFNTRHFTELPLLPGTAGPNNDLDNRSVSILESRQQRDAILLSKDFRATLRLLAEEEQFSSYDLTLCIGITRAMLAQWRERPLDRLRQANCTRVGRLIFAWKYWLHVTEGDALGRYIRHVPEGSAASLVDLLSDAHPTDEEIASAVERLAGYAASDRKAGAQRRREVGGLPQSAHHRDLVAIE